MKINDPRKEYKTTGTMVYSCQYHVIFTPKYRRSVLVDGIDERFKEIVLEEQKSGLYEILEMEVMPDHVHLLIDANPQIGIDKIIQKIKGVTAKKLREEFPSLKSRLPCLWTRGKFVSSVGSVSLDVVKKYIEDQKNV